MFILNYIYFAIVSVLGLKFLFQREGKVRSPFDKNKLLVFEGTELFILLVFSTGLLAFSAVAGTFDLMAVRLFMLELFCVIGIYIADRKIGKNLPIALYVTYLLWLFVGLFYSPSASYGLRVILKYLYPFLIMLLASAVVRNEEVFLKAGLYARAVGVISLFVVLTDSDKLIQWESIIPGVFWYGTAAAIHYINMVVLSLALYFYYGKNKMDLFWAGLFSLPCVLLGLRTSIMGLTLAIGIFVLFRYKLKSLPLLMAILTVFISILLLAPEARNKMFVNESLTTQEIMDGNISMDAINSNGRFNMWEKLLDRMYAGKEITGSGTGSTQNYLYNNNVFGGLKVPHNDYVQQLCDNGLVGIVLYLTMCLLVIIHCFKEFNNRKNIHAVRVSAIIAGAALGGTILTMLTDNVVNYSMATLAYPFGFYGMMLGLKKGQEK